MNTFEQKHKEIMESLTVNKNKAIMEQHFDEVTTDPNDAMLESHFEQMNENSWQGTPMEIVGIFPGENAKNPNMFYFTLKGDDKVWYTKQRNSGRKSVVAGDVAEFKDMVKNKKIKAKLNESNLNEAKPVIAGGKHGGGGYGNTPDIEALKKMFKAPKLGGFVGEFKKLYDAGDVEIDDFSVVVDNKHFDMLKKVASAVFSHNHEVDKGSKKSAIYVPLVMHKAELEKLFKKIGLKRAINESNLNEAEMSDEDLKDAVTKYIELKMKMKNEKQFNRKVDINRELKDFLKKHPDIRGKDDTAKGTNIFYKDKKVASIKPQYANKKVNLTYKRLKNDAINFYI